MIYIFTGPTLPPAEGETLLDAVYLPPAAHGDVYRAALQRPTAIGIVDGYFEHVPAIWHKEILWAMEQGIHVYGSASMGALRAAELHAFGMVGVGWVFEQYRDGQLEDDDEVVLVHGEAAVGYLGCSEPMVNIRQTLRLAEAQGIIAAPTHGALIALAKALFYPDRQYPALLQAGARAGLSGPELLRLQHWLPAHAVDQKKLDARQMLRQMHADLAARPAPKAVKYRLEQTEWWRTLQWLAGTAAPQAGPALDTEALLDEVRAEGPAFAALHRATLLHRLALREAHAHGLEAPAEAVQQRLDEFRRQHDLADADDLRRWLAANHLTEPAFARLVQELVRVEAVLHQLYPDFMGAAADQLRLQNRYAPYAQRAADKHHALSEQGLHNRHFSFRHGTADEAVVWFFEQLDQPVPADLGAHAQQLGLPHAEALRTLAIREFYYAKLLTV